MTLSCLSFQQKLLLAQYASFHCIMMVDKSRCDSSLASFVFAPVTWGEGRSGDSALIRKALASLLNRLQEESGNFRAGKKEI